VTIPFDDPIAAERPKLTAIIGGDAGYGVRREPIPRGVGREPSLEAASDPAVLGPEPERAVGCLEERREAIAGDALGIGAIERRETQAVEPHETIEGRQPEVAIPAMCTARTMF
jgi:hypothetical protein